MMKGTEQQISFSTQTDDTFPMMIEYAQQKGVFKNETLLSYELRRQALVSLQQGILKHEKELIAALKEDLGKSATEAYMTEVGIVLDEIRHALKHLRRWMKPERKTTPLTLFPSCSTVVHEPYGRVLIIAPWNYPVQLTLLPLAGALAAGNSCVVKPSELAPASAEMLTRLLQESFDENRVKVVNGGVAESQNLLQEHFDYIFYTGSTKVGQYVMEQAAKHLTPLTLELGGKSPVVVSKSANLRLAARRVVFGKCLNLGQTCVAPDYVLIEEGVHDAFLSFLKEEIRAMYGNAPMQNPDYGRIVNRRHFDRVCALIDSGKIVFGGETDEKTLQIAPTILDGVESEDAVMQEEIFGPVLPILTVRNLDEAFCFIWQRPRPLALYVFSEEEAEVQRFMRGLSFGGGCVNDVLVHTSSHHIPFGGVGPSGMGAYHGKESFLTFSHAKAIVKSPTWIDVKVRYQPFTKLKDNLIRLLLR